MALSILYSTRSTNFIAAAGQTVYQVAWPVLAPGDVTVSLYRGSVLTALVPGTDYTVTGTGSQSGATITLAVGSQAGDVILIEGHLLPQRQTSYTSNAAIPSDALNTDLNALLIMVQELRRDVDRSFRPLLPSDVVAAIA